MRHLRWQPFFQYLGNASAVFWLAARCYWETCVGIIFGAPTTRVPINHACGAASSLSGPRQSHKVLLPPRGGGIVSMRRLKGGMQIIFLRNSCHARLCWAHPSLLQSLGKEVMFKRSGAWSGFVMKASSKMVPGRRSWPKRSPYPMCWLTARVSAIRVLLHFILVSPKKQLWVCFLQGISCYLERKMH